MKTGALTSLVALTLLAACGDSGGPNGGGNGSAVSYAGTFASSAHSGTITFATDPSSIRQGDSDALRAATTLIGTLTFSDNSTLDLAGTLSGDALVLAGSGYSFGGIRDNGVISGAFSGPNAEQGSFSASLSSSGGAVALYCGSYTGDDDGVFSLALKPSRDGGVIVVPSNGGPGLTGRSRAKSGTTDGIEVLPDDLPGFVIATGTLFGIAGTSFDSVDGVWDDGSGSSGTFGGSTRCQ